MCKYFEYCLINDTKSKILFKFKKKGKDCVDYNNLENQSYVRAEVNPKN